MTDDLREAVENLYAVFGRYRVGPRVEGCSHCVSETEQVAIAARPLRELTAADLSRYAFKAMTTWGEVDDFKHFLPRLLELLAADQESASELRVDILLGKLDYAEWQSWPEIERNAIRKYAAALWSRALSVYPYFFEIGYLVWGFGRLKLNLRPFLEGWLEARTSAADRHLAEFVNEACFVLRKKGKFNEPNVPDEAQLLVKEWIFAPRTAAHLEEAFFRYADEEFVGEISEAAQQLLWIQSAGPVDRASG